MIRSFGADWPGVGGEVGGHLRAVVLPARFGVSEVRVPRSSPSRPRHTAHSLTALCPAERMRMLPRARTNQFRAAASPGDSRCTSRRAEAIVAAVTGEEPLPCGLRDHLVVAMSRRQVSGHESWGVG